MTDRFIDLDHAATTKTRQEVVAAMLPYFTEYYGNAGSRHRLGVSGNKALNQARRDLAKVLDADDECIYFTSGATEANNWAIRGAAHSLQDKGRHIITTAAEHLSVLSVCRQLEKEGFQVTYLQVDQYGKVSLQELENAIRRDTILVSVMYANNETGTVQPISEIGAICKKHQVLFHTDAVQAFGKMSVSCRASGIDLLTVSSHKIYGPKGIGCLYIKKYLNIEPILFGGHQQDGLRAGTEPIPEIVGFAKAAELTCEEMVKEQERLSKLREILFQGLKEIYPNLVLNGDEKDHLSNILNVSFVGKEAEQILVFLDTKRMYVSGGSACTSGDRKPSHVLTAMGKKQPETKGAIRFSLGRENTEDDIKEVLTALKSYLT